MAGKMTLYKLVVLGDCGVGKTALTIQVSYHLPFSLQSDLAKAMPQSLCRNLRSYYRGLLPQAGTDRQPVMHDGSA